MVNKVKRPSIILDSSWWNEQTFSNIDNETHVLQLLLYSSYKLKQIRRNSVKKQKIVQIYHWLSLQILSETHQQKESSSLVAWFLDQIEGTIWFNETFVFRIPVRSVISITIFPRSLEWLSIQRLCTRTCAPVYSVSQQRFTSFKWRTRRLHKPLSRNSRLED